MAALKFASSHNMVAFLHKPTKCDGFEQIVDFLNAHPIKYIQALVDKKKVIITETSIRSDLQLEDAEGTECLPNATIFEQLTLIGAKTTAWNEFSSTMASAVICLATNQKFNFSKYIFDNMVKNLEGGVKFLMYPRFVQVFLDKQVEGMSKHKKIYVTPSHTKKVFANMKRQGKDFSGRDTPLFPTMIVQAQEQEGEGSVMPTVPQHTPTINQPSSSQPQKKQKPRKSKKQNTEVSQPSDSTEPIADEAPNDENVTTHSNDPLLSGEDRLKLNELMELCTNLSQRVLDLENTKTSQAAEITKLKERVKKLERRNKSRTPRLKRLRKVGRTARIESSEDEGLGDQEDASKQGRKIADIDADEEVTLIDETQGRNDDNLMFDTGVLDEQEVEVEKVVSTAEVTTASATTTTVDELTLAQTLIEIKVAKPKAVTTTATTTTTVVSRPKARGVIVQEPNTDYELAARLQAQEQEELTIEERSKMFVELMNKRKKHFAKLKAEEQRRKPSTKAQKRNTMSTYLKNMARYKHNQLKTKSFEDIQILFDKAMTRVNTFVDMDTELVKGIETRTEGSSKRAEEELVSENLKKHNLDENVEAEVDKEAEMKKHMEIVPDDEVAIDAIPLAIKPSYINIDKEDLETLYKLVKAKHGLPRPEEAYERVLWGDLKVMFKPDVESEVWRNLQGHKVIVWKLFSSSGVHFVRFQNLYIFMLVEKKYPLTPATITEILNKKLQADH
ncbi:hypothetical protein Tco_0918582 [Tanacetum coccineum]